MTANYQCYRCGESLDHLLTPWSRRDECPKCENHVHVCRMCQYYSASAPRQCLEDGAEDVKEKERPNFCDWFKPSTRAFDPLQKSVADGAKAQLADLFGDVAETDERDDGLSAAEKLFRQ